MSDVPLIVRKVIAETPEIRSLVLEAATDAGLPPWQPGSHIRIKLPGGGDRPYSLVDHPEWRTGRHYVLGVRLEQPSTGGSTFMHGLREGDTVTASAPINQFALVDGQQDPLLLAGGIGITPIFSMAASLAKAGRQFHLHYFGRAGSELAFVQELQAICGDRLTLHFDDGPASRPDFNALVAAMGGPTDAYVCGPRGMIAAAEAAWAAAGHSPQRLRYELFTATAAAAGDAPFEVEIKSTGQVVTVAPNQSIIDALEAAGLDVIYDCRRGDCGICQTGVLEGVPDHRDVVLSPDEKASNKVMQICVSRAKSPRLVLDL